MKILVTGGNGYLGRGVIQQLLDQGEEVVAADLSTEHIDPRAERICADLFSVENPYEEFLKPDVLLHLAWRNAFIHNAETHLTDMPKHDTFLKKMVDAGVGRLCVMGSMHEIGFYEGCINENTPCNPMNQYGIAKNALRQSTELYAKAHNVQFMWLRGFYIVSNAPDGSSIFSKIALASEQGAEEFPFTTGRNQYDYLDYPVFCEQVAAAATQDEVLGIINICSGYPEKLGDRVERFIKENGFSIRLQYGAFPDRPYDSKAVWGDDKKILEILRTTHCIDLSRNRENGINLSTKAR